LGKNIVTHGPGKQAKMTSFRGRLAGQKMAAPACHMTKK